MQNFNGRHDGKRPPFGIPSYRWEDNIKMDPKELGCDIVDWIHLAVDMDKCQALVNTVMNLQVP
jgi:hypothetical protein